MLHHGKWKPWFYQDDYYSFDDSNIHKINLFKTIFKISNAIISEKLRGFRRSFLIGLKENF